MTVAAQVLTWLAINATLTTFLAYKNYTAITPIDGRDKYDDL